MGPSKRLVRHKIYRLLAIGASALVALAGSWQAQAQEAEQTLNSILNYRQYTPLFSSAGQPSREQFSILKEQGYDRVIYIAFSNGRTAIPDEDQIVKDLGMDYLHIPVDFNNPTVRDFNAFADAMQREPDSKTILHCQVNARATAFSLLYRVVYQGVPLAQAKADMNTVWQPNEVWRDFIFDVLAEHDISPDCEQCDWTPPSNNGN